MSLQENGNYEGWKQQFSIKLNEQQERAVRTAEGSVLLLAVPGSGKTTVLVARLGYLIFCWGILSARSTVTAYLGDSAGKYSDDYLYGGSPQRYEEAVRGNLWGSDEWGNTYHDDSCNRNSRRTHINNH